MGSPRETVPFEIVKEGWLEILLNDGIRVRARSSLVFLMQEVSNGKAKVGFKTAMTIVTVSPEKLRGKPGKLPDVQKEKPAAVYTPEEWKVVSQSECIYRSADGALLFLRTIPHSVSRFNAHSHDGEPYIVMNHTTDIEFASPMPTDDASQRGAHATIR